jgi:hypothetical protein
MAAAITTRFFKKDCVLEPPHFLIVHTCFESPSRHSKGLAAELQHFRHEGKIIESSLLVQRCQDLGFGTYFNQVAG